MRLWVYIYFLIDSHRDESGSRNRRVVSRSLRDLPALLRTINSLPTMTIMCDFTKVKRPKRLMTRDDTSLWVSQYQFVFQLEKWTGCEEKRQELLITHASTSEMDANMDAPPLGGLSQDVTILATSPSRARKSIRLEIDLCVI